MAGGYRYESPLNTLLNALPQYATQLQKIRADKEAQKAIQDFRQKTLAEQIRQREVIEGERADAEAWRLAQTSGKYGNRILPDFVEVTEEMLKNYPGLNAEEGAVIPRRLIADWMTWEHRREELDERIRAAKATEGLREDVNWLRKQYYEFIHKPESEVGIERTEAETGYVLWKQVFSEDEADRLQANWDKEFDLNVKKYNETFAENVRQWNLKHSLETEIANRDYGLRSEDLKLRRAEIEDAIKTGDMNRLVLAGKIAGSQLDLLTTAVSLMSSGIAPEDITKDTSMLLSLKKIRESDAFRTGQLFNKLTLANKLATLNLETTKINNIVEANKFLKGEGIPPPTTPRLIAGKLSMGFDELATEYSFDQYVNKTRTIIDQLQEKPPEYISTVAASAQWLKLVTDLGTVKNQITGNRRAFAAGVADALIVEIDNQLQYASMLSGKGTGLLGPPSQK